jgi:hypothetical protein
MIYVARVRTSGGLLRKEERNVRIYKIQETASLAAEIQLLGTMV